MLDSGLVSRALYGKGDSIGLRIAGAGTLLICCCEMLHMQELIGLTADVTAAKRS